MGKKKLTSERLMPHERGLRYFEHVSRYLFALKHVKEKTVLDAACGSGYGSNILTKKAKKVIGIDISKDAIIYSKKNYHKKNLYYREMDLKKLDFNDNTFDVVVSFETLEHVEGYTQMLSEFRRVLKKRGLLIVSTPNKRTFGCDLDVPFDKYHVTEFYHDEFKDLIDKAGFQIVDFLGQSPTRNVRWIYSLRCFVVRFPILGKIISDRYQRRMESSGNKADDTVINFLLRVIGVSLSLKRIKIISKSPSSAIYFIAVCRKT